MQESKDRKDERLAVAVEKYPVIYDKAHADHKRKDVQDNAWKEDAAILNVSWQMKTPLVIAIYTSKIFHQVSMHRYTIYGSRGEPKVVS